MHVRRRTGPNPTGFATRSPPWAYCWKTARAARPGVWRTDQVRRLGDAKRHEVHSHAEHGNDNDPEDYLAYAPRGHAVPDAPRPVLDARPAERRTLNDPLFPQPLVQCVAADAQAFGQL
ncbi:hypothetical protein ALQ03_103330 [Pseudomonas savastanoi pv. glycinea]|uniref:Uncharacterized protein n=1 Tax=Pseudomonas savastanoi pv. glycinea TaxID=318 RepID=A0A0P9WCS8_PSESG|nr:hypothetical protein ALO37_103079 [Pseudomonas savastanoi pv. glycinea]RMM84034.1 hypothetical protein ALQ75_103837 [Pseudomonas savastanoi pv. glycinea]RMM94520.1 hypothetical protein ALQ70_103228 [Pseudomonas savastanoi pv. glycinea]RMN02645.1 hypothetical protein ALQ69_104182 [Pseudomonas savastanoi pv. glycinea]RMO30371.1 hypothetical protein ALQ43_103287 [Pseudomonas savastanoi pv. glycinea]